MVISEVIIIEADLRHVLRIDRQRGIYPFGEAENEFSHCVVTKAVTRQAHFAALFLVGLVG